MTAVEKILTERFGVSINPPDYEALTSGTTVEQSSRFQAFHSEEILKIINMFEEMPSGFHKIQGLNYLIRRLDGAQHPPLCRGTRSNDRVLVILNLWKVVSMFLMLSIYIALYFMKKHTFCIPMSSTLIY